MTMNKTTAWIVLVLVVAGLTGWYFNARKPVEDHPSMVNLPPTAEAVEVPPPVKFPIEEAQVTEEPGSPPEVQPEPEPLPALEQSDPEMLASLNDLMGAEKVAEWFVTEQLINRVVATVDSLPSRQVAPLILPLQPPAGKFLVVSSEQGEGLTRISPDNAARYQPYIQLVSALDADAVVSVYVRYYPLIQQAYEALGYPGAYFNDRLVEVIDHLAATPEPTEAPLLVKPEAVYLYANEELEALSAGQKMLLRMGPENRQAIREKLAQVRAAVTRSTAAEEGSDGLNPQE